MLANLTLTITQLTYLVAFVSLIMLIVFGIGLWCGYWMGRNSAGVPVINIENRKPTNKDAPYIEELLDDPWEQAIYGEEESEVIQ